MRIRALLILVQVIAVFSGPINIEEEQCATTCINGNKFGYEQGKTYEFLYEANTLTTIQGAAEEHTGLHIQTTVDVQVLAPCEHVLRLRDVTLQERDPLDLSKHTPSENTVEFRRALEENPLRFSFQDGRIESICASQQEQTWVLNIKKGVLSAFQNSMEHFREGHTVEEHDVAGTCDAEYKITENGWKSKTIQKSKNLLACTKRNGAFSAVQATPYRVPSEIQSLPLLKSTHTCEQTISSNTLQSSECHETHVFRPFSNQNSGAITTTHQKLQFVRETSRIQGVNVPTSYRTTMHYEHKDSDRESSRTQVIEKLQEACEVSDMRPETPRLFSEVVYLLRDFDVASLSAMHREVENRMCESAKKMFHDAIPMLGSTASVSMIREMISNQELTGPQADMWLSGLSFIPSPNAEMITEAQTLVRTVGKKSFLPVSAMVHTFCKTNECERNRDVMAILETLSSKLGSACEGEKEMVMRSLKAIGNTGVSHRATQVLTRCFITKENDIEIRIAAIDAYRRMSCEEDRSALMNLFTTADEDTEARIAAYIGAMRCPTENMISSVKSTLESEDVNQVGSFVWTHLTNLMETSDPFKQDIRKIVEDETLKKVFDMDKRKFSRNYEGSMFLNTFNTGVKGESNLIWSQKSYIPRSAMLNLTFDLFGNSVNLLEFGGRAEGLEYFLESIFGPEGYFPENTVTNVLKRQRRAAIREDKLNRLDKQYNAQAEDTPSGSMYLRMFGNELGHIDLSNMNIKESADSFNILDLLIKLAQEHKVDFSKSVMFLDSTLTVPTILGMPLKLSVNGTATVKMEIAGKMDLRRAATAPASLDINGSIKPSGAVEIAGLMTVDAFVARTGLKMVTTLHSSTELDGQITLQESKVINTKFNMPKDKIELLNVESKFFIINRDTEREQKMITENRVEKSGCSCPKLGEVFGVKVCGEISYPVAHSKVDGPFFPITGPISMKASLNKVDTHGSYEFSGRMESQKVREDGKIHMNYIANVAFDTPGSQIDRKFDVDFNLNNADMTLKSSFRSPWKKANMDGALVNSNKQKSASLSLIVDDKDEYSFVSALNIDSKPKATTFIPNLEVKIPGRAPITLKGSVKHVPESVLAADLALENALRDPVTLNGRIRSEGKGKQVKYTTDINLSSQFLNTKVDGFAEKKGALMKSRMEFAYDWNTNVKHRFVFNGKGKDMSTKNQMKYNMNTAVQTSQFPDYNMQMDFNVMQNNKHAEGEFELRYGDNPKDFSKRIFFNGETNYEGSWTSFRMDHVAKLKFKAMGIDMQSKMNHRHSPSDVKSQATFSYLPGKDVGYDILFQKENASPMKVGGDMTLSWPGNSVKVHETLQETATSSYKNEFNVQWGKSVKEIKTITTYSNKDLSHEFTAEIIPSFADPINVNAATTLKIDDFEGKVEVTRRRQIYSTAVKYNYDLSAPQMNGDFDLKYPGRHILADGTFAANNGQYQSRAMVKWDADRDSSKKVAIDGTYVRTTNSHTANVKLSIPDRKFTAGVSHAEENNRYNSHADFSWAPDQAINADSEVVINNNRYGTNFQGSLHVTSPFSYAEDLKLGLSHHGNGNQYRSEADYTWAEGKSVGAKFELTKQGTWKNIESSMSIETPFFGYRKMTSAVKYNLADSAISAHYEGAMNKKTVVFDINGNLQGSNLRGSAELQTPMWEPLALRINHIFRTSQLNSRTEASMGREAIVLEVTGQKSGARNIEGKIIFTSPYTEDMSASINHNDDGRQFNTVAETTWAPSKTLRGEMKYTHQGYGQRFQNQGEIQITTPFSTLPSMAYTWSHNMAQGALKTENTFEANRQSVVINFDGESRTGVLNGKLTLQTPSTMFRELVTDMSYQRTPGTVKSAFNLKHNGEEVIAIDGDFQTSDVLGGTATLKTKYEPLREISLTATTTTRMPYNGHAEIKWSETKKIALDGELAASSSDLFKGNLRLTSPFQNFESIFMNVDHALIQGEFKSNIAFEYAPERKVELATTLASTDELKATFTLNTPCPHMKTVYLGLGHSGSGRRFKNNVAAKWVVDDNTYYYAETSLTAAGLRYINGQVKLQTPLKNFEDIELNLRHGLRGSTWATNLECQYTKGQSIEVETKLDMSNGMKTSVEIKTPLRSLRKLDFSLDHSGALTSFDNEVQFMVASNGQRTKLDSTFNVRGLSTIKGTVKYECPRANFEMSVNHGFDGSNLETSSEMTYNGKKMAATVSAQTQNGMKATVNIETPFNGFRTLNFDLDHAGYGTRFVHKHTLNVQAAGRTINVNGNMRMSGLTYVNGQVTMRSNFRGLENVVLSVDHSARQGVWSSKATLNYGEKIELTSEINTRENKMSLQLATPFTHTLTMSGNYEMTNTKYGSSVEMTYAPYKTIAFASSLDLQNGFKHSLTFSSPCEYVRSISTNLEVTGTLRNFNSKMDVTHNLMGTVSGAVNMNTENDVEGTIEFNSPWTKEVKIVLNHRNQGYNRYNSVMNVNYHPGQEITFNSQLNLNKLEDFNGRVMFTSPFTQARSVSFNFNHRGNLRQFNTHMDMTHNNQKSVMDASFQSYGAIRGTFKMETPYSYVESIDMSFSHEGELTNFKSNAELTYNGNQKIQGSAMLNVGQNTEGKFEFSSPFYDTVSANLMHQGGLLNFRHSSDVTYARNAKVALTASLSTRNGVTAGAELSTPFMQTVTMSINHEGTGINFRHNSAVACGSRKATMTAALNTRSGIDGSLEITAPFMDTFTANMNHKGDYLNFEHSSSVQYGSRKATMTTALNTRSGIDGSLEITAPFMNTFTANMNHKGDYLNFEHSSSVQYGSQRGILTVELDTRNGVVAKITSNSPYYKPILVRINHVGSYVNFEHNSEVKYGRDAAVMTATLKMNNGMEASFGLETPFTSPMSLSISHVGDYMNFRHSSEIKYGNQQATATASMNWAKGLEGHMEINTPFFQTIALNVFHEGDLMSYKHSSDFSYASDRKFTLTSSMQVRPAIVYSMDFTTPFAQLRNINMNINHRQRRNGFESSNDITVNGQRIEATGTLNYRRDVDGKFSFVSPWNEKVELEINHEGSMEFKSSGKLTYSNGKMIAASGEFKMNPTIEGNFRFQSPCPHLEDIQLTFNHDGDMMNFQNSAQFNYARGKTIEGGSSLRTSPEIVGSMTFKSPFQHIRDVALTFKYEGGLQRFNTEAEFSTENIRSIKMSGNFRMRPLSGGMHFESPFEIARDISMSFKHNGDLSRFESEAKMNYNNKGETSIVASFANSNAITGSLEIKSPIKDISMKFNHQGSLRRFQSGAELNYGQTIKFDVTGQVYNGVSGTVNVETPFNGARQMSLNLQHKGGVTDFENDAEFTLESRSLMKFESRVKTSQGIDAFVSMKTPYMQDVSAGFTHAGGLEAFRCTGELNYNGQKTFNGEAEFSLEPLKVSAKVNTAFEQMREMSMAYTHRGSMRRFQCDGDFTLNGRKMVDGTLTFKTYPSIEGSLRLNTPVSGYRRVQAVFNHNGDIKAFNTHFELTNEVRKFTNDVTFTLSPLEFTAKLQTPFTSMNNVNAVVKSTGNYYAFESLAEVEYDDGKIQMEGNYKASPYQLKAGIKTPFDIIRDAGVNVAYNRNSRSLRSNAVASYNGEDMIALNGNFNFENTDMSGSMEVKTPFRGYRSQGITASTSGDWSNFKNTMAVTYGYRKSINTNVEFQSQRGVSGSMSVQTPFTEDMSMEFNHAGSSENFNSGASVTYSPRKTVSGKVMYRSQNSFPLTGSVTVETPMVGYERMNVEFTNAKQGNKYDTKATASWTAGKEISVETSINKAGSYASLNMDGTLKITTPFSNFREFVGKLEHQHSDSRIYSKWDVDMNRRKIADFEVRYDNTRAGHTARMTMAEPTTVTTSVVIKGTPKDFTAEIALNDMHKIEITHKDESSSGRMKREIGVKTTIPSRIMSFSTEIDSNRYRMVQKSALVWDQARARQVSYEVNYSDRSRGSSSNLDISGSLVTPIRTFEAAFTHKDNQIIYDTQVDLKWDAARDRSKMITMKNHFENNGNQFAQEFNVISPAMQNPFVIRNEVTLFGDDVLFAAKSEVDFNGNSNNKVTYSTVVKDVTNGRGENFTVETAVSYPAGLVDIQMVTHIADTPSTSSAGLQMNYLTSRRQVKNLHLMGEIQKLSKMIKLELFTPMKALELNGKMVERNNVYSVNVVGKVDKTSQMSLTYEGDMNEMSNDLKVFYSPENPSDMYHMYAKYLSPTELKFEAYRSENGQKFSDGEFDLDLKNKRLVHSKLTWNPSVLGQYADKIVDSARNTNEVLSGEFNQVSDALMREYRGKSYYLSRSMPDMSPVVTFLSQERQSFAQDWQTVKSAWTRMYYSNEFYMQDIVECATKIATEISEQFEVFSAMVEEQMAILSAKMDAAYGYMVEKALALWDFCGEVCDVMRAYYDASAAYLSEKYENAMIRYQAVRAQVDAKIEEYKDAAMAQLILYVELAAEKITPIAQSYFTYYNHIAIWMNECIDKMQTYYSDFEQLIVAHPKVKEMKAMHGKIMGHLNRQMKSINDVATRAYSNLNEVDLLTPVRNFHVDLSDNIKSMTDKLHRHATYWSRKAVGGVSTLTDHLNNAAVSFLESDNGKYVKAIATEAYHKTTATLEHYNVEETIRNSITEACVKSVRFVKKNALYFVEEWLQLSKDRLITYDPRRGQIEFEVYIPMDMPSLQTVPIPVNVKNLYSAAEDLMELAEPILDFSPWDTYYNYKPSSDVLNWIPPFKATASISGRQHFITFDGKYYEFAGSCSYVLARDMINNNFTIIANYDGNNRDSTRKSFTVITNGKHVEIFQDFRTTVDGSNVELPIKFANTTVTRSNDMLYVVNTLGLNMTCDMLNEACTFEVSGWYFGKLAGLLGTYNNEENDDFTTSSGQVVSDISEFAHSWQVGSYCRTQQNLARTWTYSPESPSGKACYNLFKARESPLRPCFKVINPIPFMRMCVNDLEDTNSKRSVCKAAALYAFHCRKAEIEVSMPKACGHCDTMDNGETSTVKDAPRGADVVFVVEEKKCNEEMAPRLGQMVTRMRNSLKSIGMKDNRFGIVGFTSEAHSHTMEGQLLNTDDKAQLGLDSLHFDDESESDVLGALKMAANYPFRAGASKNIILVTCSQCNSRSVSEQEIEQILMDREIVLHVLKEHEFEFAADLSTPKSNYLFGIDDETAYLSKHVSDRHLTGDKNLFDSIVAPKDTCAILAQKTQGSIFNLEKLNEGRVRFQKHFIDVFSRRVVKTGVPTPCQVCQCENGVSVCRSCDGSKISPFSDFITTKTKKTNKQTKNKKKSN